MSLNVIKDWMSFSAGEPLAGLGFSALPTYVNTTRTDADVGLVTIYTNAASQAAVRVDVGIIILSAATGGTISGTVQWTDVSLVTQTIGPLSASAVGSATGMFLAFLPAGNLIQASVTRSGITGSVTYRAIAIIERLV